MNQEKIMNAVENSLCKSISNGDLFKIPYENKIDLSNELRETYKRIDYERVFDRIKEGLEEEIAKKIVDKIVTEMSTDIKKLMGNASVREDFRFFMRSEVELILKKIRE